MTGGTDLCPGRPAPVRRRPGAAAGPTSADRAVAIRLTPTRPRARHPTMFPRLRRRLLGRPHRGRPGPRRLRRATSPRRPPERRRPCAIRPEVRSPSRPTTLLHRRTVDRDRPVSSRNSNGNANIDVTAQAPGRDREHGQRPAANRRGQPPDVAQLGFGERQFAAQSLSREPHRDVRCARRRGPPRRLRRLPAPFHPRTRTMGVDGSTFSMPYVFSTPVLFYNANLFRRRSRPGPAAPDLGQFKQAGLALTGGPTPTAATSLPRYRGRRLVPAGPRPFRGRAGARRRQEDDQLGRRRRGRRRAGGWQDIVGPVPRRHGLTTPEYSRPGKLGMFLTDQRRQSALIKGRRGRASALQGRPDAGLHRPRVVPTNSGSALYSFSKDPAKQAAAQELIPSS
ncbi:hypothetical protein HBB16_04570 [Pseudonocardia sp. MCCB 268]|nr:hypothetical protein [Pseudonocardia cytotoxica]